MEIDIRGNVANAVDTIRVCGESAFVCLVDTIVIAEDCVKLQDSADLNYLTLEGKEHAQNLIKGLQKAIDLGWFE